MIFFQIKKILFTIIIITCSIQNFVYFLLLTWNFVKDQKIILTCWSQLWTDETFCYGKKTMICTSIWIKIDEFHNPKKVIKKKNDNEYFFYIMCDKMFNWIKWIDLLWRTNIILFLYYDFHYLYMAIYNLPR